MTDVIVIGAGHNGLTAAAYLARAGCSVTVLEAQPFIGGMTATTSTLDEAPGYRFDHCAVDMIGLFNTSRSVVDELRLADYGLRFIDIDPYATYLGPDGISLSLSTNLDRTVADIARYSKRDAQRYRELATAVNDLLYTITPYLQGHPKHVRPSQLIRIATRAAKSRKTLATALRIMVSSPLEVMEEWFSHDVVKTCFSLWAMSGMAPLEEPGSGAVFAIYMSAHRWGCRRPVGGMGSLPAALARFITAHGGTIRTSAKVREVCVEHGAVTGVVLDNGDRIDARQVIGALDPTTLFTGLVDPTTLPQECQEELRGLTVAKNDLALFRADAALSRKPVLRDHGDRSDELLKGGFVMVADDFASVRQFVKACSRGELLDRIPLYAAVPSMNDRSVVPDESDAHGLYVYVPLVPLELAGKSWSDDKWRFLDQCIATLDEYAPGLQESVITARAKAPDDYASWVYRGNPSHADITFSQLGPWRPTPSLAGYKSPVTGLWHTAAGAHPLPGVNGWSGRTAAACVTREIAKPRRR